MLRRLLYSTMALVFLCVSVSLGQGTITGNVQDASSGEDLPGVNIFIQSINMGASTDLDGNYTINNVPAGEYQIQARFVGFRTETQSVTVSSGETTTVDFTLRESAINLDEVVVTGTGGPVEKKKIGNSIGTISSKSLENVPISSFSDVLQGREPGMVALPSGGLTGEGTRIRIRGSASLSQSNEPIIYIDGVRVDNAGGFGGFVSAGGGGSPSRLDDINPDAIDRIEILKGASAATLYGTEASNGVIQVFTKKGNVGDGTPRFDISVEQGITKYPQNAYPDNTGFATTSDRAASLSDFYNQDISEWQLIRRNFTEELFETGLSQTYSLSASGGTPGITYFISGRFNNQDGPFGGNNRDYPVGVNTRASDELTRGQLNANINVYPTDRLQFRVTTGYTDSFFSTLQTNNNIFAVGSLAQFSQPELAGPNNSTGSPAFATVNEAMQQTVEQNVQHFNGSIGANYRPIDMLMIDGTFGIDFTNQNSDELRPFGWNIDGFTSTDVRGSKQYADRNFTALSADLKATLSNRLSESFTSDFILGGQLVREENLIQSGSGVNFPGPGFQVVSAASDQELFEFFIEEINAGVFAQEQVGFNDYLFVTVGGRLAASRGAIIQSGSSLIDNGAFTVEQKYNIEGSLYYIDEWLPGEAVLLENIRSNNIDIKIDTYNDEVHFLSGQDILALDSKYIKSVILNKDGEKIIFRTGFNYPSKIFHFNQHIKLYTFHLSFSFLLHLLNHISS